MRVSYSEINMHYNIIYFIVAALALLISLLLIKKLLKSKKQAEYAQKHFPAGKSYKEKTSNKRTILLGLISVFFGMGVGVGIILLFIKLIGIYYPELIIPHKTSIMELTITFSLLLGIMCIGLLIGSVVPAFVLRPFFTEEELSESKDYVFVLMFVFFIPLLLLIPLAFVIIVLNLRSIPFVIRIIMALIGLWLLKKLLTLRFGERDRLLKCKTCGSPLVDGPYVERHGGNDHFKCTVKGIPTKVCPNGCPGVYSYQRNFSDDLLDAFYDDSQNVAKERSWSKARGFCRRCDVELTDKRGRAQFVFHHHLEKGTEIEVTVEAPCLECTRCGSKYLPPERVDGDDELADVIGEVVDQELICK